MVPYQQVERGCNLLLKQHHCRFMIMADFVEAREKGIPIDYEPKMVWM